MSGWSLGKRSASKPLCNNKHAPPSRRKAEAHLKLMSKQSEGLIEGQRKTQRNDALHEDPCVDLVCRKVCKKERYVKGGNRRTRMRSVSLSLNTAACQRRAAKWSKVYPVSSE